MADMMKLGPDDLASMQEKGEERVMRMHPDDYNELVPLGGIVFVGDRPVYADTGVHVLLDPRAERLPKKGSMGVGLQAKMDVKLTVEKAK